MTTLSPGVAQGCFDLLGIASRHTLSFPQIHLAFAHFGSLATGKIIETAQRLNWLRANDNGVATLTPWGDRLLGISGYAPMLRQALLDYIDVESPPWVQNATFGRARVLAFASNEVAQVFVEAELSHGTDAQVVAFWDSLAARARGQKNSRLTAIGREGERLTIAHEEARTGRMPKWVAIDNNEDGYDVLSVVAADDSRQLSIEVKASSLGYGGAFHITQNEWERSQTVEHHLFHLWAIKPGSSTALAVVTATEMEVHIPDNSGSGSWELVEIPFSTFRAHFQPIAS
jgi:hypothetical protein